VVRSISNALKLTKSLGKGLEEDCSFSHWNLSKRQDRAAEERKGKERKDCGKGAEVEGFSSIDRNKTDAMLEREDEEINQNLIEQKHTYTGVFARSDTEILFSNPTRGMDICLPFVCVGLRR
jgi:hypothetical protein